MDTYVPLSVVIAWLISHVVKEIVTLYRERHFSWYALLFETGGMPSSHAATVSALSMAVLLQEGFTVLFWAVLLFSLIVIRDAFGVRKSVSDQAEFINILIGKHQLGEKLDVVLGHTPVQVAVGVTVGVAAAALLYVLI